MKRATVVIGANYGDEGKGLMVDYLASQTGGETVVVRFNGGAQAGHTVWTPDGKRHVFSHFGSGTLAGAETYLAKHYVCNPVLFWEERRRLSKLVTPATVAVDPRCYVSTPYDMLLNQLAEDARGDGRHGSVGVGFGETIERNQHPAFRLLRADLSDRKKIRQKLRLIRDGWMAGRCRQLNIPRLPDDDHRLSDHMLDGIVDSFVAFDKATRIAGAEFLRGKSIIFEGAQGLGLDMNSKNFPHVTRSNTGLTNVMPIAKVLALSLDVIYMTRTYLTRHGAGPLPDEHQPDPPIVDDTNTDHPYQGRLRFAPFSMPDMLARIDADRKLAPTANIGIGLTWLDHVGIDALPYWNAVLAGGGPQKLRFYSMGPRRDQVAEIVGKTRKTA